MGYAGGRKPDESLQDCTDYKKGVQLYLFLCIHKNLCIESQKAENSLITCIVLNDKFYCDTSLVA